MHISQGQIGQLVDVMHLQRGEMFLHDGKHYLCMGGTYLFMLEDLCLVHIEEFTDKPVVVIKRLEMTAE